MNDLRLSTKRLFSKALAFHREMLVDWNSARARHDRTLLFKFVSQSRNHAPSVHPSDIPDDEWYAHFESEFSFPDPHLQDQYDRDLDAFLASSPKTH